MARVKLECGFSLDKKESPPGARPSASTAIDAASTPVPAGPPATGPEVPGGYVVPLLRARFPLV